MKRYFAGENNAMKQELEKISDIVATSDTEGFV